MWWSFYAISQGILGVKPAYEGLMIDPCLPAELSALTITRKFRGSTYNIRVINRAGDEKGKLTLTVNGEKLDGCLIPAGKAGETYDVEAVLE